MQIHQKPGYHIKQGHLICLFAHLALKIKCVLDVMSLSNIWLGDLFSNNKTPTIEEDNLQIRKS